MHTHKEIHIHRHTHTHICTKIHADIHESTDTYTYIDTDTLIETYAHCFIYTYTHIEKPVQEQRYIRTGTYTVHSHMEIYAYIKIRSHTNTYIEKTHVGKYTSTQMHTDRGTRIETHTSLTSKGEGFFSFST